MRRRRGIFEGYPRAVYRRTGARYIDACASAVVLNGVAVAGFGVVTLVLYVDVSAGELALFAAGSAAWYAVEGLVAGTYLRGAARPVRAWLAGERHDDATQQAWLAAARLPLVLLRRPSLYAIGAAGTAAVSLALAAMLELPAYEAALLLPAFYLLYVYSAVLRYLGLELTLRPVLEAVGESLPVASPADFAEVSLHRRLLATVPIVTWGAGVAVAGLLTENTRDFDTLGLASVVAIPVTAVVSIWVSLVLADSVSGPIIDLRDATRRVGAGDLGVRVPVVCTDETGELAASFNAMVAGLGERERLREALGSFVDPALAERVLAEGTDLQGEERDVSVLFLDVRGFTAFAERAAAHEVVATLNELYEAVVPVILRHGGHANKFIGDGLLAVFGAPERHADHAVRAVAAAREIAQLVRDGMEGELSVGVGVNSGRVVVGTIGGGGRRDFTVIGDPVNTAARVEAATRVTGDDVVLTAPPQDPFPPDLQGRKVAVVAVAWSGDLAEGERVLAPLRAAPPPAVDLVGPMPYMALQSMIDETAPHGWRFYDRLHYLPEVSDGFIDALLSGFESVPAPQAHVVTGWMGGAIDRVAPGATAFGHRDARAFTWIIGCSGQEPVGPVVDWVRHVWEDTAPFATGGVYVNALNSGRPVRDAYADDIWDRLLAVKRRYDPDGAFDGNGIR